MSTTHTPKPTNDDILDIATHEFAEKGYDGARMEEIAHAAQVNKATLYYRIGDKDALFGAVLKRMFTTKLAHLDRTLDTIDDVDEKLHAFARVFVAGDHPTHFAAIMLREIAAGGRNLPDDVLPLMGRIVRTLECIVEQGVREGKFRDVNPFLTHMMLVGGLAFYATNKPIRERIAAQSPDTRSLTTEIPLDEAAAILADTLLHGVRKA